jgi:hypothetical protein
MKLIGENRSTRGKNLSQCQSVRHKSAGLRGERPATNRLSHGTANFFLSLPSHFQKYDSLAGNKR